MQNNDMINEFLDGAMSSSEEDTFLLMMASSDELKHEFKRAMFIDNTLKEEAAIIAPSTKSAMKIFSAVGISYSNILPEKSLYQRFYPVVKKYLMKSVPVVVTAILVSLAVSWYYNNRNEVKTVNIIEQNDRNQLSSIDYPVLSNYLIGHNKESGNVSEDKNYRNKSTYTANQYTNKDHNIANTIDSYNRKKSQPVLNYSEISPSDTRTRIATVSYSEHNFASAVSSQSLFNFGPVAASGISVSFFGTEDKSLKDIKMNESSSPFLARNGIEIMYSISEIVDIGVDLRQEYFFQDYKAHIDNEYYQVYQHPNLFTGGLSAKIKLTNITDNTTLVTKLGAGYNIAGPVLRTMIGIDYNPTESFGFSLGIENSNLFYTNEKVSHVTPKLGINYSVKFNL